MQRKLMELLYESLFEQGLDLGDIDLLATRAEESGIMSKTEVRVVFALSMKKRN
jgi:predicted DsbA family dithiol-disulfide isomerase